MAKALIFISKKNGKKPTKNHKKKIRVFIIIFNILEWMHYGRSQVMMSHDTQISLFGIIKKPQKLIRVKKNLKTRVLINNALTTPAKFITQFNYFINKHGRRIVTLLCFFLGQFCDVVTMVIVHRKI